MKILEMPAYFPPHNGGIEYVVHNLSKEWVKQGHKVKVITSSFKNNKKEIIDGIKVKRVKSFSFMQDAIAPLLFFKLHKADIVHIHHPHPFWIFISALYCRSNGIPYVFHMYGREIIYPGWKNIIAKFYNTFFLDFIIKHSAKTLTHSRKVIPQSYYMQKYIKKLEYVKLGTHFVKPKKLKRDNFIFCVGMRDYKRLDLVIRALPLILRKIKTKLVIAGEGVEKPKLEKLVEEKGLTKNVIFTGYISEEQKYGLYQRAGVFVLPSPTIMESFGLVAFEALTMKCPPIVSSGAGISEVFEKENIGLVVQPYNIRKLANAIIKVLKDKKFAKRIGEEGYKIIKEKYQWNTISREYFKIFEEVIQDAQTN